MNFSTVGIYHRFGNGEAKSKAAKTAGNGSLSLLESVEDFFDLVRLDPDSGIGDTNFNFVRQNIRRRDRNSAVGGRKFDAVFDQIPKHLL